MRFLLCPTILEQTSALKLDRRLLEGVSWKRYDQRKIQTFDLDFSAGEGKTPIVLVWHVSAFPSLWINHICRVMVWNSFNASPDTSQFCLSQKTRNMPSFLQGHRWCAASLDIFQHSANISHHFQTHHASSPFTPAPRTVTSVAMALAEVAGDLWFSVALPKCQTPHLSRAHAYFNFVCLQMHKA